MKFTSPLSAVSIAALCGLCGLLPAASLPNPSKPNIVFILADDLGYGDLGCYNPKSKIPTPNLDRLAAEGMRFTDAHAPDAVCTPTRYGLLTGRYSFRSRLKSNVLGPWGETLIEEGRLTVPALLRQHGYATACFGKWHLGWQWPTKDGQPVSSKDGIGNVDFTKPIAGGPIARGFDYYFGVDIPNYPPYCFIENDRTVGVPSVASPQSKGGFNRPGPMLPGWNLTNILPELTVHAIRYLEEAAKSPVQKPFFLYFPLTAPHYPIVPAPEFKGRSQAGDYGDFVAQVDGTVGDVLTALTRTGLATNTLVFFTSDNGPEVVEVTIGAYERVQRYEHASMDGLRGAKRDAWEGGHRVPFIARWPGSIPAGSVSDELICTADLFATFADLADVDLDDASAEDSFSVLPALVPGGPGRAGAKAPLRPVLVSDSGGLDNSPVGDFAIREGRWKLIVLARDGDGELAKRRFPVPDALDGILLFDLASDPEEQANVATGNSEIVTHLSSLLERTRARGARFLEYAG